MRYIRSEKRIINEDRELMYMSASKLSSVFHLLGIIHYILKLEKYRNAIKNILKMIYAFLAAMQVLQILSVFVYCIHKADIIVFLFPPFMKMYCSVN